MEDLTDELSKRFGISFKRIAKVKDGLIINCAQGNKLIKKTEATLNRINFSHNVKELLYARGFKNIDRYRCAKDGKPYAEYHDDIYIMTDVVESSEIDFDSDNIKDVFSALAQLHKMLKGCDQKESGATNHHTYYYKRKRELSHVKKWISSQSNRTQFDIIVMQYYDLFYKKTEDALKILDSSNFKQLLSKAQQEKQICHNNFREENVRISNGVYISGFEKCGYNHHIFDISEMLSRYIKKSQTTPEHIFDALKCYTDVNALTEDEIAAIFQRAKFPDKFLELVNQHYNRRRTWVSQALVRSLEKAVSVQQRKDLVIDACLNEIGRF